MRDNRGRALSWGWETPTSSPTSRYAVLLIAKLASSFSEPVERAFAEHGIVPPTEFGMFYMTIPRMAHEMRCSPATVRRVIKSLVACGILLVEKDRQFAVLAQGRARGEKVTRVARCGRVYYPNHRVIVPSDWDHARRSDFWSEVAQFVAYELLDPNLKTAKPKKLNPSKRCPDGSTMGDHPGDLVKAMRRLVPSEVWPPGFGPEDALLDDQRRESPDTITIDGEALPDEATAELDVDPSPSPTRDEAMAAHPSGTPTQASILSESTDPSVVDLSEKIADKQQTDRIRAVANDVLKTWRGRMSAQGRRISPEQEKQWWGQNSRLARDLLWEGVEPGDLLEALWAVGTPIPKAHEVRSHLPARFRPHMGGNSRPERTEGIAAANVGAQSASQGVYDASDALLADVFKDF